ncbi:hypothetical protein TELCIR_01955 [Teladorsagia circumcincta]|uniref:EF-hand domain-containing protein n=1 Tax=Teladorsagia circumcincta TaxID=45464 RepID=A0A2G9V1Y2_TELCI|nr:hypothetical protein TELCIR_01955 [Teladorsagia circumcincta]
MATAGYVVAPIPLRPVPGRVSVGDMKLEDVIEMFPHIEPFLVRKWHYAFYTFFDLIGNNVIEWKDFQRLIDAIGELRGEDGTDHVAARSSLTEVWQSMTETMGKDVKDQVKSVTRIIVSLHDG